MSEPTLTISAKLTTNSLIRGLRLRKAQRQTSQTHDAARDDPAIDCAAVLDVFDPRALGALGAGGAEERLRRASVPAVGWRDKRYRTLLPDVRLGALQRLGGREQMKASLAMVPRREMTGVQLLFERWLNGDLQLERLSYRELEEARQLYDWGLEPFGGLPSRSVADDLRARRASVALFEHLVDSSFVGREGELQKLRDFVGVVDPSRRAFLGLSDEPGKWRDILRLAWEQVRAFLVHGPRPPLVISGGGGVGKTALVGKFLLEHVNSEKLAWFPFAYISFESDSIDVQGPWTILVAAADQLASQFAGLSREAPNLPVEAAFRTFREAIADYRRRSAALVARAGAKTSQNERARSALSANADLYTRFGVLLASIAESAGSSQGAKGAPVVMVLDTFERVAYRTDEDLLGLWDMLQNVQQAFPALRVIISGRDGPRPFTINKRGPERWAVPDLSEAEGVELLTRLGVTDALIRTGIVRQVGANPLTLRLAARAARDEQLDARGFAGLRTRRLLIARLGPELIHGQLYRRILDHMTNDDPDVRKLAHPGMALRRVTADIIAKVLAPVCELADVTTERAGELFVALRQEHALVRLEVDRSLRYREEVRTPMLDLLAQDQPDQLKALHRQAADYYAADTAGEGAVARAEELYHRMMLDEDPSALEYRWDPAVAPYLAPSVGELPDSQKLWLAGHMSLHLPPEVYSRADTAEWERHVGGRAVELARYGEPNQVLGLLRERTDRTPGSPLYPIEMRALMSLGRFAEALAICRKASDDLQVGNQGRLAEVVWLGSQAALAMGNRDEAIVLLLGLADLTSNLVNRLPQTQALTQLLGLGENTEAGDLRAQLALALDHLAVSEIDQERSLLRLACVRLGLGYPDTLRRVLRVVARDLPDLFLTEEGSSLTIASSLLETLRALEDPGIADALRHYEASTKDAWAASALTSALLDALPDTGGIAIMGALVNLMSSERSDLSAATLAGLETYRESFELRASSAVAT